MADYNNAKLEAAISAWLEQKCKVGRGMVYSGAAQKSFEEFLRETRMLRSSPGKTAFGREMNRMGFGRKRHNSLQYMTGLTLLLEPPKEVTERRTTVDQEAVAQKKSFEEFLRETRMLRSSPGNERSVRKRAIMAPTIDREAQKQEQIEVQRRMKLETRERVESVKQVPLNPESLD